MENVKQKAAFSNEPEKHVDCYTPLKYINVKYN